ncbi:hypothetical protein BC835DRAFT_1419099 [Cytidiella melzeri]|nr:hypothetical protein BC835DRAFT_1419099 [Cytidiella melzeri]
MFDIDQDTNAKDTVYKIPTTKTVNESIVRRTRADYADIITKVVFKFYYSDHDTHWFEVLGVGKVELTFKDLYLVAIGNTQGTNYWVPIFSCTTRRTRQSGTSTRYV